MKIVFNFLYLISILVIANSLNAQSIDDFKVQSSPYESKFVLDSGSLDYFKGDTSINFLFVYNNLMIGEIAQEDYVNRKVEGYNSQEAGRGDEWRKIWFNDQKSLYPTKFEMAFKRYLKKKKSSIHVNKAKYTVHIKTTFIEPGFNAPVVRMASQVELTLYLIETGNPNVILARLHGENMKGYGGNIASAYSWAGNRFGAFLVDNVLKK